jgi:hypothetical protein
MTTVEQSLMSKIRTLSPQQVAEVEDFVEFLATKARKRSALDRLLAIAPALEAAGDALVTVRIEEEAQATPAEEFVTDDPAFGIWRDREDMADVAAYVRKIRQPRYNRNGSRNEP